MDEMNNLERVGRVLDYIEAHLLEEKLDLDTLAKENGYSKYHLHRMFAAVVGLPLHQYVKRRRLTEAARRLNSTDKPIMEIALCAGYDTQRSFSSGFKSMFHCSPRYYRKHRDFLPLQLKYDVNNRRTLRGDMMSEVRVVEENVLHLAGYEGNTGKGFSVIGQCWHLLHKNLGSIQNRVDKAFLIGVNDYSSFEWKERWPVFRYIAAAQVSAPEQAPEDMTALTLPASSYVVFSFRGRNEDSLQPVVDYVYQEWFPHSTCRFNENNPYDFAKYGEKVDALGQSDIQFWVPVASADI